MKEFDDLLCEKEPRWFSVFCVTDDNGNKDLMAIWGAHAALPLVTQLKLLEEGKMTEKYCMSCARNLDERDAIVQQIREKAIANNWEDEE